MNIQKSEQVSYRKLRNINIQKFKEDVQIQMTQTYIGDNLDDMIERFNTSMTQLINIHAPIIHRSITPRPHAPWYTEELHDAKRRENYSEYGGAIGSSITESYIGVSVPPYEKNCMMPNSHFIPTK